MRIIEDKTQDWKFEVTCTQCESRLEIVLADIAIGEFGGSYCEAGTRTPYVVCAVCDAHIQLKKLPTWVRDHADRTHK